MKKILILFVMLNYLIVCKASHITEVFNFQYNHMVIDFDMYLGSVLKYEDRIFLNNQYKIEELQVLEDGTVEHISMYETKTNLGSSDFIDENRYYSIREKELGTRRLLVFDISCSPMVLLTEIDLPYNGPYGISQTITNNYIYFSDYQLEGSYRFCKETMQIDGFLPGLFGMGISYQGKPIILFEHYSQTGILNDVSFRIYEELLDDLDSFNHNDFLVEVFSGALNSMTAIVLKEDKLFLLGRGEAYIFDLSDLNNIELIAEIQDNIDNEDWYVGADMYENKIYLSSAVGHIQCYELIDGELTNIFNYFDSKGFYSYENNLVVNHPYIYYSNGTAFELINVEDINNPAQYYGRGYGHSDCYVTKDDFYASVYNLTESTLDFYSAFAEESYMFSIAQDFAFDTFSLSYSFCIDNDLLYLSYIPIDSQSNVIDVYQITNNNLNYLYQISTNYIVPSSVYTKDNLLFIQNDINEIKVYNID
ncbi:MAG: hypothetical protein PHY08_14060, partial [Candidatus Cloacimonetes bacterium]|nr:hypothetical protein [Candidatus Cloacimonadota bacterium]